MKIAFVEIQNFRKLKACRIEFGVTETLLVGANNSGKTSAMDALILFLAEKDKSIETTDFTLSNWSQINQIGERWVHDEPPELGLEQWRTLSPTLDVWIDVDDEIHRVTHLIPTLSWTGGQLGVRLIFEPKTNSEQQTESLYQEFINAYNSARLAGTNSHLKLWPFSLKDFLDKKLSKYFEIHAYILNPEQIKPTTAGVAQPQLLQDNALPLTGQPFDGLIKVDIVNAQRGFTDAKSPNSGFETLSAQLRKYYDNHLTPFDSPTAEDVKALGAIDTAKQQFDTQLQNGFSSAFLELQDLGYPGFTDPKIKISSQIKPLDGLNHDSAVQFDIQKDGTSEFLLPEKYNGLGYQNLVSMVFKLIRFRDEWLRHGKKNNQPESAVAFEPLHLVLIEEPEAHLHAQVQQVFIKKAYSVLRKGVPEKLRTQFVVSSHSSHIAHEIDFSCLRYFRRNSAADAKTIPYSTVENLSDVFGKTTQFATRYLKTTHCDLFFADAVILVEGPAERMLVPHFIKKHYPELDQLYITVLEIGGSHAHTLQPLIEKLGIFTLVVTDIDSVDAARKKAQPIRDSQYATGNDTLEKWWPKKENLIELLDLPSNDKYTSNQKIRVAYQCPIFVGIGASNNEEALPYTFEDALILSNIDLIRELPDTKGLLKKMQIALSENSSQAICKSMFDALDKSAKKAEMALDLLYITELDRLKAPAYIAEGLQWLQDSLTNKINNTAQIGGIDE